MDAMARALLNAAAIIEESELSAMKKAHYASFDSGIGKDFEDGKKGKSRSRLRASRRSTRPSLPCTLNKILFK